MRLLLVPTVPWGAKRSAELLRRTMSTDIREPQRIPRYTVRVLGSNHAFALPFETRLLVVELRPVVV